MPWWKGVPRLKLSDTLVGLLVVLAILGAGWLLDQLMVRAFVPLSRPLTMRPTPTEPSRWDHFSEQARQFTLEHEFQLVGLGLSLLAVHFLWLAVTYVFEWKRSGKEVAHPKDSWEVTWGLIGFVVSISMLLAWVTPTT